MFENLNLRSAKIVNYKISDKDNSVIYKLKWKGNIEFLLYGNDNSGWYYKTSLNI